MRKLIILVLILPALTFAQTMYLNNNLVKLGNGPVRDVRLCLPDTAWCAIGLETNVYFDNVVLTTNYRNYTYKVVCDSGAQFSQRWTYTPRAGASGGFSLSLYVYDEEGNLADADTMHCVVSAKIAAGSKTILLIGDSLFDQQTWPHVLDSLTATYATYIGTKDTTGTDSTANEGLGGTSWYYYTNNVASIFRLGGTFSFATYLSGNSLANPDYVIFNLGTNDIFSATEKTDAQINTILGYADTFIADVLSTLAGAKIGICLTVPPSYEQDSFGDNYSSTYYRGIFKRSQHRLVEKMIARYGKNGTNKNARVSLIPTYIGLDTEHNMKTTNHYYNARNATQFARQSNGVHPAYDGYEQLADITYCWLAAKW